MQPRRQQRRERKRAPARNAELSDCMRAAAQRHRGGFLESEDEDGGVVDGDY